MDHLFHLCRRILTCLMATLDLKAISLYTRGQFHFKKALCQQMCVSLGINHHNVCDCASFIYETFLMAVIFASTWFLYWTI